MPRKFITQEVKDQNRESQRRSRARRTELINDLKKQVQDYQRQGASASLEMQRMAQAVTFENQRLRSLLSAHGVSQEEIRRYISSPPALSPEPPGGFRESGALKCKTCGSTSIILENPPAVLLSRQHQNYQTPPQIAANYALPSPSASCETIERSKVENNIDIVVDTPSFTLPPAATQAVPSEPCIGNTQEKAKPQPPQSQEGNKSQCCGSRSNENDRKYSEKSSEVKPNLTTTHPLPKHIAPEATSPTDSMETSCDTAASILVDLHHHMDTEQARAALGCRGSESCNVSNIKIFQLLEKLD